jgi:hypothetical protein
VVGQRLRPVVEGWQIGPATAATPHLPFHLSRNPVVSAAGSASDNIGVHENLRMGTLPVIPGIPISETVILDMQ